MNPRLIETIGNLDLLPAARRVGGPGTSYLIALFTHVSFGRPSRFTNGAYGLLHAADRFETALAWCFIPEFDGAIFSHEWKDALWARFTMGAPR